MCRRISHLFANGSGGGWQHVKGSDRIVCHFVRKVKGSETQEKRKKNSCETVIVKLPFVQMCTCCSYPCQRCARQMWTANANIFPLKFWTLRGWNQMQNYVNARTFALHWQSVRKQTEYFRFYPLWLRNDEACSGATWNHTNDTTDDPLASHFSARAAQQINTFPKTHVMCV